MKPFGLNIHYDGNAVNVDYCDGSDVVRYPVSTEQEVKDTVHRVLSAAMEQEDESDDEWPPAGWPPIPAHRYGLYTE